MSRIVRTVQPGGAPGQLIVPTGLDGEPVRFRVMCYREDTLEEAEVPTIEEALAFVDREQEAAGVTWIDVVGIRDVDMLRKLGRRFQLHPLALEDVLNVGQRPKVEFFDDHIFLILRQLHFDEMLQVEQVSLFFTDRVVVTLQEWAGDPFEGVRQRIRSAAGRVRSSGADYLAYSLVDALVDSLYPVLEKYGEWIEALEDHILHSPDGDMLEKVHQIKRDLLWMRRTAWPHRELVQALERHESPLISDGVRIYIRDCYDHCVQIMDVVDTFRDLAGGLTDLYLSSASQQMNEVMKVLTIMASIFIPLTFIAGIYGMNFDSEASPWNMPELHWIWGYPVALGVMALIGLGMFFFFKRKKWL